MTSPVVAHLPFADHVHKLDATQNDMRTDKRCACTMATLVLATLPAIASADTQLTLAPLRTAANMAELTRNACGAPDTDARLVQATPIDIPSFERSRGGPYGTASLVVNLASNGRLLQATVLRRSGHRRLDNSALEAIRSSRYVQERRSCADVGGTYQVDADFDG